MDPTGELRKRQKSRSESLGLGDGAQGGLESSGTDNEYQQYYQRKHGQRNPLTEINLINQYIDQKLIPKQFVEISAETYQEKVLGYAALLKENQQLRLEVETLLGLGQGPSASGTHTQPPRNRRNAPPRTDINDQRPLLELPPQILDYLELSKEQNLTAYRTKMAKAKKEWQFALQSMGQLKVEDLEMNPAAENYLGQMQRIEVAGVNLRVDEAKFAKRRTQSHLLNKTLMAQVYSADRAAKKKKEQRGEQDEVTQLIPYKIRFKLLDMNEPENLRDFLQYIGQPSRPFRDIQEELAVTYLRQFLVKFKVDKKHMEDDLRLRIRNLKRQLVEHGIAPQEQQSGSKERSPVRLKTHSHTISRPQDASLDGSFQSSLPRSSSRDSTPTRRAKAVANVQLRLAQQVSV